MKVREMLRSRVALYRSKLKEATEKNDETSMADYLIRIDELQRILKAMKQA